MLAVVAVWLIPIAVSVLPSTVVAEAAWKEMDIRQSLREEGDWKKGGSHLLRSRPGMDLILEHLSDLRRANGVQALLSFLALAMMVMATAIETGSTAWNFILLVGMCCALAQSFHANLTSDLLRQQGDKLPVLTFYSPTHHNTQFNSMLGDLLIAHLDPDLMIEWEQWMEDFRNSLLFTQGPGVSRERLLYLLHLHSEDVLDEQQVLQKLRIMIPNAAIERLLLDEEATINWRSLQRLIAHARAWQTEASRLLDRLQSEMVAGTLNLHGRGWRLDSAMEQSCEDGTGHLFIALNKFGAGVGHVRLEVIAPSGEPEVRDHRLEVDGVEIPASALPLISEDGQDVLELLPDFLTKSVVLWLRLSWNRDVRGQTQILVHLKDDEGHILESQVLSTIVHRQDSSGPKQRVKRLVKARKLGDLPLPEIAKSNANLPLNESV